MTLSCSTGMFPESLKSEFSNNLKRSKVYKQKQNLIQVWELKFWELEVAAQSLKGTKLTSPEALNHMKLQHSLDGSFLVTQSF